VKREQIVDKSFQKHAERFRFHLQDRSALERRNGTRNELAECIDFNKVIRSTLRNNAVQSVVVSCRSVPLGLLGGYGGNFSKIGRLEWAN